MADDKKRSKSVEPAPTTEETFARILVKNLDYVEQWEAASHKGEDIEGVHQMRVGLRRLRSALSVFRRAIPREISAAIGEEMRWAASALGPARDLDVFLTEGLAAVEGKAPGMEAGTAKLRAIAEIEREEAYKAVREMIDSDRYKTFKAEVRRWAAEKGWRTAELPPECAKMLDGDINRFAAKVLTKQVNRTLADGLHIAQMPAEELHQLRIDCKKVRYATEFFTPLFNAKAMGEFVLRLKDLQGLLGTLNDVTVTHGLMVRLLEGVDDRDTIQFSGVLIGWRVRQYEEIKGQLGVRWQSFAQAIHPWV
ncbi:MAG: CHAD domain-containing protein [Magnetococcales bacterium]|nr:CHAD domain-containing protein [Magnetococcales bacterium]